MARTWANEASGLHVPENHARRVPPPPAPGAPTPRPPTAGARYRPDFTQSGDRVDFDRVMMESWRPKAVRPQTDPFYVPGPGSEPPPMELEGLVDVEPLSREKIFFLVSAALAGLIVATSGAYALGRSVGRPDAPVAVVEEAAAVPVAPAPRVTRVEVGTVTVEPLPAATALVAPLAPSAVESAEETRAPRIRPLATPEPSEVAGPRPRRRARQSRAERAAASAEREATAAAAAAPAESESSSWRAPALASWDDVVPAGDG